MSAPRILVLAAALFSTAGAFAQTSEPRVPSRAETLADLEIYEKSGLRALEQDDLLQIRGARYEAAKARYEALRASPAFAARVLAIAQGRGETPVSATVQAH